VRRREFLAVSGGLASTAGAVFARDAAIGDDVFFASIAELNKRLLAKEFSCVELTRAFCDRLERLGPRYNALVLMLREPAIRLAKDADGDLKRERTRSPLQGVPFGAKDLLSVEGRITAWGARPYAAQVFDYTATVLKKLEKAQAPLIGKLAMVELAGGPTYSSPGASATGPGLNPWNRGYWSGGSSSGSGAAVAAGLVPFALGSETSGSILTPAAFCGITGLRPTFGLVSRFGAMELSRSLDKIGPMCRTAEDCGIVLQAIAGGDSKDPFSAGKGFYFAPQFARPLSQLRVGYAPADFDVVAAESARPALKSALAQFRDLGVQLVEIHLSELPEAVPTLIRAEGSAAFRQLIESGKVEELADRQQIDGLKEGLKVTAADYIKALDQQREVREAFSELFHNVDVILAPSRLSPANKANEAFPRGPAAPKPEPAGAPNRGTSGLIPASNVAGIPALSIPCGFVPTEGGDLPVGLQLVGRWFAENTILSLGMAYQQRTDWHKRRPNIT